MPSANFMAEKQGFKFSGNFSFRQCLISKYALCWKKWANVEYVDKKTWKTILHHNVYKLSQTDKSEKQREWQHQKVNFLNSDPPVGKRTLNGKLSVCVLASDVVGLGCRLSATWLLKSFCEIPYEDDLCESKREVISSYFDVRSSSEDVKSETCKVKLC